MKLQLNKKCKISKEAKIIIQSRLGYRNDYNVLGGRTDSFKRVLAYETLTLGNRDIYHTVKQYYNIGKLDLRHTPEVLNRIILNLFAQHFGCNASYLMCYWLCANRQDVIRYYGTDNLKQFVIPDSFLIASDLGPEGILIVSATAFGINELY